MILDRRMDRMTHPEARKMKNEVDSSKQGSDRRLIADVRYREFDILSQQCLKIFAAAIYEIVDDAHAAAAAGELPN
jgi:hypothetical protein